MPPPAIIFESVWKKFSRAQRFNSLRDLVPATVGRLFTRPPVDELQASEFWALQDVSFEVGPGETLGIIGPNGAGKSTALKILTRILRPEKGRSVVRGRVGALVEVAAGFHPDLTGRENVFMQGAILGMKRAEIARKFDAIVDFAGIPDFIDTPVKRYSSGMNARLGFAVAAHIEPEVLIIDEVLSVGDLAFQEKCYERMRGFARSGIAIVFVSHNLSAVSTLCTNTLVLRQGRMYKLAPTHEAIGAYTRMVHASGDQAAAHKELMIELQDGQGRPATVVGAGQVLRVSCSGYPPDNTGARYRAELLLRHLETGSLVYRAQSHAVGADPVFVAAGQRVTIDWQVRANLGRGHYAVSCVLLSEQFGWAAVSSPALLTVDERQSEQAVVFLDATCALGISDPAGVPAHLTGHRRGEI
jgi:lipopolysaccharide transport system ATP-binding protein